MEEKERVGGRGGEKRSRGKACRSDSSIEREEVRGSERGRDDGREEGRERKRDGDAPGVMQQSGLRRVPWCVARVKYKPVAARRRAGGEVE